MSAFCIIDASLFTRNFACRLFLWICAYTYNTRRKPTCKSTTSCRDQIRWTVLHATYTSIKTIIPVALYSIIARTMSKVLMNLQTCISFHEASNKVETMQTNLQTVSSTPREQTITDAGSLVCICKQLQRKKHFLLNANPSEITVSTSLLKIFLRMYCKIKIFTEFAYKSHEM